MISLVAVAGVASAILRRIFDLDRPTLDKNVAGECADSRTMAALGTLVSKGNQRCLWPESWSRTIAARKDLLA
jgi:hypothetical protein